MVGVNLLLQVAETKFDRVHSKNISKLVKNLKSTSLLVIPFPNLDELSVRLVAFLDVSFPNLEDISS